MEVKSILEQHALWLADGSQGKKANLRGANLREANLREANLSGAALVHDSGRNMPPNVPQNPEKAAGIIAALSPSQPWGKNILYAGQVLNGRRSGIAAYPINVTKAARIADGEQPLNVLSGPKVRAFHACILSGGNTSEVCVDGHAYAIAKGERIPTKQAKFGPAVYRKVADAYRDAAAEIGIPAAIVQAVTWVVYRDLHGLSYAG